MSIRTVGPAPAALPSHGIDRLSHSEPATRPVIPGTDTTHPAPTHAVTRASELEQVKATVESANRFLRQTVQNLEFSVDEETGRTITRLVDTETRVVLRQFPSEEMLSIGRTLDHLQGLLVRQKA